VALKPDVLDGSLIAAVAACVAGMVRANELQTAQGTLAMLQHYLVRLTVHQR